MKRIALAAVITLTTATVAWLLWRFRGAASLFVLSIVTTSLSVSRVGLRTAWTHTSRAPAPYER